MCPALELPRQIPPPDDASMVDQGWGHMLDRRAPKRPTDELNGLWIRVSTDHDDDPVLQACALAFMSDAAPSRPARRVHPAFIGDESDRANFQGASLDHSVWFHRPYLPDEWLWFDCRTHGLAGARGLVTADVVSASGVHVATIAQQVLLRRYVERPDPSE